MRLLFLVVPLLVAFGATTAEAQAFSSLRSDASLKASLIRAAAPNDSILPSPQELPAATATRGHTSALTYMVVGALGGMFGGMLIADPDNHPSLGMWALFGAGIGGLTYIFVH